VEIFDLPDSGYVHSLRAASLSLIESIFKSVEYVGDYTIIDRILDIVAELESLADNVELTFASMQADFEAQIESIRSNYDTQLDQVRARLTAGGL
jgi:hypothetical protein